MSKRYNIKYTKELLEDHISHVTSYSGLARSLGLTPSGGTLGHLKKRCQKFGIDCSHITGQAHNKGKVSNRRKPIDELLIDRTGISDRREKTYRLRRALKELGVDEKCSCGVGTTYNGLPLVLHIDHIDGNPLNDLQDNLRFICPNCHSQTDTFAGKNCGK